MTEGDRTSSFRRNAAAILCTLTAAVLVPYLWPSAWTAPALLSGIRRAKPVAHITLAVAALSARHHQSKRQSLRQTWAGYAKAHNQIFFRFVVGNEPCRLPPGNRIDEYSCRPGTSPEPGIIFAAVSVEFALSSRPVESGGNCQASDKPLGLDFEVIRVAVFTHLGLFDFAGDGFRGNLTVSVWDTVMRKEVVSVVFSPSVQGLLRGGFRYLPVPNYAFPAGFLGSVVVKGFSANDPLCSGPFPEEMKVHLSDDGVVKLGKSRAGHTVSEFPSVTEDVLPAPRYLAGSFLHRVHVQDSTSDLMSNTDDDLFTRVLADEEKQLQREMQQYGDIELVPVMDVYRNLPKKLLLFFRWLLEQVSFDYVLKTDDDCFVNVPLLLSELNRWQLPPKNRLWWGSFRYDWKVERFGKWRELNYLSTTYPPFACGAGNVLSVMLVRWLASNSHELHCFQGEDVSMGIWLSGVLVGHLDDSRWQCFSNCSDDALAIPNLNNSEVHHFWKNVVNADCGKVCGCKAH